MRSEKRYLLHRVWNCLSAKGRAIPTAFVIAVALALLPQMSQGQAPTPASPPAAAAGQTPAAGGPPGARGGRGGRGPRYVEPDPINFDEHTGWQNLFDGSTLNGWDGPTDIWNVEDGTITATNTAANPASTYLIWTGGQPGDFEFKTEMKLEGEGSNSGIQFRATKLGPVDGKKYSAWDTRGYQADFDYLNSNTGALIECCAGPNRGVPPRPDRAFRGQIVRTALQLGQKPSLLATIGDPDQLKGYIKVGDWNQIHLIARGNTMIYIINGRLMSVMLDDNPTMAVSKGYLAVQLEGRGDIKVHFRNMWLKNLP